MNTRITISFCITSLLAIGCGERVIDNSVPSQAVEQSRDDAPAQEKADQWGPQDKPTIFDSDLEFRVAELPTEGQAANTPWAASYWPVYQDSINYRWNGANTDSAATKYGKAFGVDDIEDKVSKHHGVDAWSSRTACEDSSACNSTIGESCAKRTGETKGYCIPTWWGICHAWAPASIMIPEPKRPVTRNGVEFKINDIKALATLMHNRVASRFVSLRCNEDDAQDEIEFDDYDRPTGSDVECKDTNPGTYHVLLTNYLGLRGESFVEDRTWDDEVWNQPLRAFRVTKLEEVTAQKANALVGVQPEGENEPTRAQGTVAQNAWHHVDAITTEPGKTVTVSMTGTNDADLYVKVGSQPTLESYTCRPWVNGSTEKCEVEVAAGETQVFVSVHGYSSTASDFDVTITLDQMAGVPTDYVFNDEATQFFYVKSEVDYIAESPSSRDGNLADEIDAYTHTDHYEYILEVDADGKINGGEWLGASKKAHPDFLWLPTARREYPPIAGGAMKWDLVKSLLDESVADPNTGTETLTEKFTDSVAKGAWKHYGPFNATDGAVTANLSGSGDGDLYVRKGSQPTASTWDCRPYKWGTAEKCTAQGPGAFYVSVFGYEASDFELTVTYNSGTEGDDPEDPEDPVDPEEPAHLNESGHVAQGEMKFFSLPVTGGQRVVTRTQAAGDVDLYVRMNLSPTVNNYDKRAYTYSGNETVDFTAPADGVLHIAVNGYAASDFVLTTAAE